MIHRKRRAYATTIHRHECTDCGHIGDWTDLDTARAEQTEHQRTCTKGGEAA